MNDETKKRTTRHQRMIARAQRDPFSVLNDTRWLKLDNCRLFFKICAETSRSDKERLQRYAFIARTLADFTQDPHVRVGSLRVAARALQAQGLHDAARQVQHAYLDAAEKCCADCRDHAHELSATDSPEASLLGLAGAATLLQDARLVPGYADAFKALYEYAEVVAVNGPDVARHALEDLAEFRQRLVERTETALLRLHLSWICGIVLIWNDKRGAGSERLRSVFRACLADGDVAAAAAVAIDLTRAVGVRFQPARAIRMFEDCLEALAEDSDEHTIVSDALEDVRAGGREAVPELTEARRLLRVPVPDLLASVSSTPSGNSDAA